MGNGDIFPMDGDTGKGDEGHDSCRCYVIQELYGQGEALSTYHRLLSDRRETFLCMDRERDALSEYRQIRPATAGKEGIQEDALE